MRPQRTPHSRALPRMLRGGSLSPPPPGFDPNVANCICDHVDMVSGKTS